MVRVKNAILIVSLCLASAGLAGEKTLDDTLTFLKAKRDMPDTATLDDLLAKKDIVFEGMTDGDFEYLVPLCKYTNIALLRFYIGNITGSGLKIIADQCGTWDSITSVDLAANPLLDEHLVHLGVFPNTENLNIDHDQEGESKVSGEFLKSINLTKLKSIWAKGTNFSNENARLLLTMPSVEEFNFWGTSLSEETLSMLGDDKIDVVKRKWDLKRVRYEAKKGYTCFSFASEEERLTEIARALHLGFLSEESANYLKESNFVPLVVQFVGQAFLQIVCRNPEEKDEL